MPLRRVSSFGATLTAEVRRHRSGRISIHYSDEAWTPCACCDACKREAKNGRPMIESHYRPTSLKDAEGYARYLAGPHGEVRVVKAMSAKQSLRRASQLRTAAA